MAAYWGHFFHPQDRPLLFMLDQHEQALERALTSMLRGWESQLDVPDLGEAKVRSLLVNYLARVGDQAVIIQDRGWRKLERKDVQSFRAERVAWAQAHGATLAVNLTAQMQKRVASIIAAAEAADLSPDQLRRQIAKIIPALPGITVRTRAELIARTELHNAAMWAQEREALGLAERGAEMIKSWTATMDKRTRPHHRRANGQTKPLDQDFIVGGRRMSRPGDPKGGAHNCIRCRCVARYMPKGYEAEDRQRRAADLIRMARLAGPQGFRAEIAELTAEMDPSLAAAVRAGAGQTAAALEASADALAAVRLAEEGGDQLPGN